MKKLLPLIPAVALVAVAVLLFSAQSPASQSEEFSIRNGIKFGMSPDEVKAIEGIPEVDAPSILKYQVNIQDLEKAQVLYFFSRGKYLGDIRYEFRNGPEESTASDFELVDNVLKEKYGEPENGIPGDQESGENIYHKFTVKTGDNIITVGHGLSHRDTKVFHSLTYSCILYDDPANSF